MARSAVIVDVVRSPFTKGKPGGALSSVHPVDLQAQVLQALFARTDVDPAMVEDLITGCVMQVGEQAANIGRQAWLAAGLPETVPAVTIDRKCGSCEQALHFAAQGVIADAYDVVAVSGVEMMSRVEMKSNRLGLDNMGPMFHQRYPHGLVHQGISAELIAAKWNISREEMDELALGSHQRATAALRTGVLTGDIVAIRLPDGTLVEQDEGVRKTPSIEKMRTLNPAFKNERIHQRYPQIDWSVTAANSSQVTDGAAAMLIMEEATAERLNLKPKAAVRGFAVVGDDPIMMLTGIIPATRKLLDRNGLSPNDIDLFEVNEAFASVVLAWQREMGVPSEQTNVSGGAIAFGHPVGASGGRLTASLLSSLAQSGKRYGVQTMCESGGMANATLFENLT